MQYHGYIDESGTLLEHEVLTVALVIMQGPHTAERLHLKLSKSVFVPPKFRGLAKRDKWFSSRRLHFTDLNEPQKLAMGAQLARADVSVYIASYWHSELSATHNHRFLMYQQLVKATINAAFETLQNLTISISKQGGWESYGTALLAELEQLPHEFTKRGNYRKGRFMLAGTEPGQQLADFFAGAKRHALLSRTGGSQAYELIQHLVRSDVHLTEEALKAKEK